MTVSIPSIRSFQFDTTAASSVKNSVNLFRGDVNLTQPLFTMPCRTQDKSLDVNISLLYQSNVLNTVTTWNADAPTSIVGLGWGLPRNAITLDKSNTLSRFSRSYSLTSNGNPVSLVREQDTPYRFATDASNVGTPTAGGMVAAKLVTAFGQYGILLAQDATYAADAELAAAWQIIDTSNQQIFSLRPNTDGSWSVFDGGESYQLQSYDFSRILYYSQFERWVITDSSGIISSYGGRTADSAQGQARSDGGSIAWAVAWVDGSGAIVFNGASAVCANQTQYATAWYLRTVTNLWGDQVAYAYNEQWPADSTTGVRPVVEQPVGVSGLPYTKACYLTSITDVFGRRAVFNYRDKLWLGDDESPREYADPHKSIPDDTANAYQDCYETQFLDHIQTLDKDSQLLFRILFLYNPNPGAKAADGSDISAVANINAYGGPLKGNSYKRYLTGLVWENADGTPSPPLEFAYHLTQLPEGFNPYVDAPVASLPDGYSPGALRSMKTAEGAVSSWKYTWQSLSLCARSIDSAPPADFKNPTPRVWFGSGYAVVVWYDNTPGNAQILLQTYTWYGRWVAFQPDVQPAIPSNGIDLAKLNVVTSDTYFAPSFSDPSGSLYLYIYTRDVTRPGVWLSAGVHDKQDQAVSLPIIYGESAAALVPGQGFLLVPQMDSVSNRYQYDRLTYNWNTRLWLRENFDLGGTYNFLVAANEYYLTLDVYGNGQLYSLSPAVVWRFGSDSSFVIPNFNAASSPASVALVPSSSMVAVSQLYGVGGSFQNYAIVALQWNENYHVLSIEDGVNSWNLTDPINETPTSHVPAIIENNLIACARNILRFDGTKWQLNQNLLQGALNSDATLRYAYGPDYAVQVYVNGSNAVISAQVLGFDPNSDLDSWGDSTPQTPKITLQTPQYSPQFGNWPSAGQQDFLAIGNYLYFRGTSSNWETVVAESAPNDLQALVSGTLDDSPQVPSGTVFTLNSQSVINQAPQFLAYTADANDAQSSTITASAMLKNGQTWPNAWLIPEQNLITLTEPDAGAPGVNSAGQNAFVTYPEQFEKFTDANRITLTQYAGNSLAQNIIHYTVTAFSVDKGMGPVVATAIRPNPLQATSDPTGGVIKYYETTLTPATEDPKSAPYGTVIVNYLNGFDDASGDDYYGLKDGLLAKLTVNDSAGSLVSQVSFDWQIYTQRATDPSNAQLPATNLYQGFVVRTGVTRLRDGVTATLLTDYINEGFAAPWSNQAIQQRLTALGSSGQNETNATQTLYGCQLDKVLRALNLLTAKAQTSKTWALAGQSAITTSVTAATRKCWPCQRGEGVLVPGIESQYQWVGTGSAQFPYSLEGTPPDKLGDWQIQGTARSRLLNGLVCEGLSSDGILGSALYESSQSLPVATIKNAGLDQWAYQGFEDYESTDSWVLDQATIVSGDAYTGEQSLKLAGGLAATASTTITSIVAGQRYVLAFALKTPAGFDDTASGWTLVMKNAAGDVLASQAVVFVDTEGVWDFFTAGVQVPDAAGVVSLTLTAANRSDMDLLLDAVCLTPLVSDFSATNYNPRYRLPTDSLTLNGRQSKTVYNRFGQSTASLGPEGQILLLSQNHLSRQGSAHGDFDAQSPNASLILCPANGGQMECFTDGDAWQRRWTASNYPKNWQVQDGVLTHTASSDDTLSWSWPEGQPRESLALSFEAYLPTAAAGFVCIRFGTGYAIGWDATTATWRFSGPDDFTIPPLANPPALGQQWLLTFASGQIFFHADGQLLFSAPWQSGSPDALVIDTADNVIQFRNLGVLLSPRLSLNYADATGANYQTQQLADDDVVINQTITDPLNRSIASTKAAPASFGVDGALPLLCPHPNFVNVDAFLDAIADSWVMEGDLADYYAGQTEGGITRADDQGYPYSGTRYEAAPRKRRLETGQPGKDYAICDLDTSTPAQRQTTQYGYGNAGNAGYLTQSSTSPVKSVTTQVNTVTQQTVATQCADAQGTITSRSRNQISYLGQEAGTPAFMSTENSLPNALLTGPQGSAAGCLASSRTNTQNYLAEACDPDNGATNCLYDPAGRLRFAQVPLDDPNKPWFIYAKYDALGRIVEQGAIHQAWDADALATVALNDPSYPVAGGGVSFAPARSITYDGTGDDRNSIGKIIQIMTTVSGGTEVGVETADPVITTEDFTFDVNGQVVAVTNSFSIANAPSGTIRYEYNNLKELTRLTYPQGAPLSQVVYLRDALGQIKSIGTSEDTPGDFVTYKYTPNGNVSSQSLPALGLDQLVQYNSPGWVISKRVLPTGGSTPVWSIENAYYADARVQQSTEQVAFAGVSARYVTQYQYDSLRRLLTATVSGDDQGNETINTYDPNGNIWSATVDGTPVDFQCQTDSDKLQSVQFGENPAITTQYNARGLIESLGDLKVAYDPILGVPNSYAVTSVSACRLQLAYGAQNQRTFKRVTPQSTTPAAAPILAYDQYYFCGSGNRPLAINKNGQWTVYVMGPDGVAAIVQDKTYYPIKDIQGSTRAILDAQGNCVAHYRYRPFGFPIAGAGPQADISPFRYMGQEWDGETALYNFIGRTYNPALMRFHEPDPRGQFASPFVFVGNDPVTMVDPDGQRSIWAQVATFGLMATVAIAGAALTLFTGGASDAAAAEIDADLGAASAAEAGSDAAETGLDMADAVGDTTKAGPETIDESGAGAKAADEAGAQIEASGASTGNTGTASSSSWWDGTAGDAETHFRFNIDGQGRAHQFTFDRIEYDLGNSRIQQIDAEAHETFHQWVVENCPRWMGAKFNSDWAGGAMDYLEELAAYNKGHRAAAFERRSPGTALSGWIRSYGEAMDSVHRNMRAGFFDGRRGTRIASARVCQVVAVGGTGTVVVGVPAGGIGAGVYFGTKKH